MRTFHRARCACGLRRRREFCHRNRPYRFRLLKREEWNCGLRERSHGGGDTSRRRFRREYRFGGLRVFFLQETELLSRAILFARPSGRHGKSIVRRSASTLAERSGITRSINKNPVAATKLL